jgi:hypothetical protein
MGLYGELVDDVVVGERNILGEACQPGVHPSKTSGTVARMRQDRVQMLIIGLPPRRV